MNKADTKKYLKYLNVKENYTAKKINCEICSSKRNKVIKKRIHWNNNVFGNLPVVCCLNCGFLFQNPRFNNKFYSKFYAEYYRQKIYHGFLPSKYFLQDQKKRGLKIFKFIKKYLNKNGTVLDVGCSVGLMLKPFINFGWKVLGYDPDINYVNFGIKKFNLPIKALSCENMILKKNSIDVIIIAGSLEHCYDPNKILKICSKGAKKNSLLILEARGDPRSTTKYYFNHNHHRYFSLNSLELIMIKYGWKPFISTNFPVSGPTREGGIWCIGRYNGNTTKKNLKYMINNGKRETFDSIELKFKNFDMINKSKNPNRGDYRNKR